MLNYANLNDYEFECLCKDIMSRMLNKELRRFSSGRDKGIDLTDDVSTLETVVQVKHYVKTPSSGLIQALKNEVSKVVSICPKKYYVCCAKELTAENIKQIYNLFLNYMENDSHIITLIEIDKFLTKDENKDILINNYKLWLSSTGVLDLIYNNNIFIDSEILVCDIKKNIKLFVKTIAYEKAIESLKENRILILTGEPGVGKTITSQMLVMNYAAQSYKVRHTTDGLNLSDLKKALSRNKDEKEIILLDDCFGQIYFNMKETQTNEIISLIKYVNINPNKILILNSRVTIYSEAKQQSLQLMNSLKNGESKINILDMNNISMLEKAKILYNHMYFNNVNKLLIEVISENKNYLKIIKHNNYSPRIIEFICNNNYDNFNKKEIFEYVINKLNNPSDIWDDEYERKLSKVDRLLITTLYSLTLTTEAYSYFEKIFNERIIKFTDIDITKSNFSNSIKRLQKSMINIIDIRGKKNISMINPSVNDYLRAKIIENTPVFNELISNAVSIKQLERLLSKVEFDKKISNIFSKHMVDNYIFPDNKCKNAYITWFIVNNNILDDYYRQNILGFLLHLSESHIYYNRQIRIANTLKLLFQEKYSVYYNIREYFDEYYKIETILENLELMELVDIVAITSKWFEEWDYKINDLIEFELDNYLYNIDISEYDIDMCAIIEDNKKSTEFGDSIDSDAVYNDVYDFMKSVIEDEVYKIVSNLPKEYNINLIMKKVNIDHLDISDFVETYIESLDYDYDNEEISGNNYDSDKEIDILFS